MARSKGYNVPAVVLQAQQGQLSVAEMKRHIKRMLDSGSPMARDAAMTIRAIVQREQGRAAVEAVDEATPGSAKWAFAQLGAAMVTPYRWSGTTAEGEVVVALWDEPERFGQDYLPLVEKIEDPERRRLVERMPGVQQNRTAYFRDLEVAVAAHRGLVKAILATAVDINAIPRQRKAGSCRPWYNEDGSPVILRVTDLDIGKQRYRLEFAEPHKKPRCPFERS
jgi:hypothetical protein